jgi:thiamine transport system ATP-binding protein
MALRLENLILQQGSFRLEANLEVPERSFIAVIGPSGAGKSTLFDAIAGFLPPASGGISWRGQSLGRLHPGQRPVAVLFQDNNLFPHLTVGQNVGLAITQRSRLSEPQKQAVDQVLSRVGLEGLSNRKPSQLSGGQISRAALARLLLQDKPLWLLDEPFSALGPALKAEMLDLVREVSTEKQATVLMITHDPQDARAIAPLSLLVAEGTANGPYKTDDLLDSPPPALAEYLGS